MPDTLLDALIGAFARAADYNSHDQVAPAALFIPDAEREWELLAPRLRERVPLLILGNYNPTKWIGPAIWLRCVHARALSEVATADGMPVFYFPNVSLQDLCAVPHYPHVMQPLADLYYRSVVWVRSDGQPWNIPAFLASLGVATRDDETTRKGLRRALPRLAEMELDELRAGAPWKASDLDLLLGFQPGPSLRELILEGESDALEFKATSRWDVERNVPNPEMERLIWKTVAAFLNSYRGGILLIGVSDNGEIHGIEDDFPVFKEKDRDRDGYEQWLYSKLLSQFGRESILNLRIQFHFIKGKHVCQITVKPSHKPVFVEENGVPKFYLRTGNASNPLNIQETVLYSLQRWGNQSLRELPTIHGE